MTFNQEYKLAKWALIGVAIVFLIVVHFPQVANSNSNGDATTTFWYGGHRYIKFFDQYGSSVVHDPDCPKEK